MQTQRQDGNSTCAVHGGAVRDKAYHALTTPIVQTATYTFATTQALIDYMEGRLWGDPGDRVAEYARYGNPTVIAAEKRLAALDGAEDAVLYASGMAAITSLLLTILPTGAHIIMTDDCYKRTRQFATTFLQRLGITTSVVPMGDYDALEAAITDQTRLIISESPTNPYLRVLDLQRLAAIGRAQRVLTLIDSTFATPINQRPAEWGIDFVLHSATKYLGGHNDLLAGVITGGADLLQPLRQGRGVLGGVLDANAAFMLERGLKTVALRVAQQNRNAQAVAAYLETHPRIERVWYPGLESHPDHAIAAAQMDGFGGVVSFEVAGDLVTAGAFIDRLRIPYISPSLGGVESLICQPALVSYYELSTEERLELGIKDNLVRFAIGIEDTDDILSDLEQALA